MYVYYLCLRRINPTYVSTPCYSVSAHIGHSLRGDTRRGVAADLINQMMDQPVCVGTYRSIYLYTTYVSAPC